LKLFRKHTDNHKNSVEIQLENKIKRPLIWQDEFDEEEILDSNTTIDRKVKVWLKTHPLDLGVVDYFTKDLEKKLSNRGLEKRNFGLIGIARKVNVDHWEPVSMVFESDNV